MVQRNIPRDISPSARDPTRPAYRWPPCVPSRILPPETSFSEVLDWEPGALILSGGPSSVYDKESPQLNNKILSYNVPILGICYGLQLLVEKFGGLVNNMPKYAQFSSEETIDNQLSTIASMPKKETKVPNFLGMTLRQSIQEAKLTGLTIKPVGTSGRVVWQSVTPGQQVHKYATCQIKLESM